MEQHFRVGVIANTHGLKGQVKVYPTTDDANRFKNLKKCYIDTGSELITVHPKVISFVKNMVILKFKEYDHINDIEKYKGLNLLIDRADAVPLEDDEFYIADMIDAPCYCDNYKEGKILSEPLPEFKLIGSITDIFDTGANFCITVRLSKPVGKLKELIIPIIPECVLELNDKEKYVKVHLMKGLI